MHLHHTTNIGKIASSQQGAIAPVRPRSSAGPARAAQPGSQLAQPARPAQPAQPASSHKRQGQCRHFCAPNVAQNTILLFCIFVWEGGFQQTPRMVFFLGKGCHVIVKYMPMVRTLGGDTLHLTSVNGRLPHGQHTVNMVRVVHWIPFGDHPLKLERYRED